MDLEKRPDQHVERPPSPVPPRLEQPPAAPPGAEGCLAVAIRVPVRIVVLVLVVPVRLVWDALAVCGRFVYRNALRPVGRGIGAALGWLGRVLFVVPLSWLYRWVLTPVGHGIAWVARGIGTAIAAVALGVGAACGWLWRIFVETPAGWLYARVLTPVGHAFAWLARLLGAGAAAAGRGVGAVLTWLFKAVFVWPWVGLWRYVVVPVGAGLAWLARILVVVPLSWLYQWVLTPVGHGIAWLLRMLLVVPAVFLWRWVLAPVGRAIAVVAREIGAALGHAWRVAGHISLVVGRFLGKLLRWIFVEPVRWAYRTVLTPVGHAVRDLVWRPAAAAARGVGRTVRQALASARDSVRQARADVRRMLFGAPKEPVPVPVARREPDTPRARTLGSSTTALMKD
ncbi:hypothetical protein [Streptomyces sp. NPDC087300]|uniref:hypothetical protein n=1 Tax=Streptomyces sp. NPDC087300 TaxID=3365780 RepID=UPI003821220B